MFRKHPIFSAFLLALLLWPVSGICDFSFATAKRLLEQKIYNDEVLPRREIYCGCPYDARKRVDVQHCGYEEPNDITGPLVGILWPRERIASHMRNRMTWEHAMPMYAARRAFDCYREPRESDGGSRGEDESPRKYCARVDSQYAAMEGDMHNLWPSLGQLNADRGKKEYGMVLGELRLYGLCDFEIGLDSRVEPSASVRGDLARSVLYMADRYGIRLSTQQRKLMEAWHREDPADRNEKQRNESIRGLQGAGNHWIVQ